MNGHRELDMKIVEEVQKEGREYLFQLSHTSYRNTCLKQNTWREIASSVGSTQIDTMKRWKALRSRYVKLNKKLKNGSAAVLPMNTRDKWLMRALNFLKCEIINGSNNECDSEIVQLSSQTSKNSNPSASKILILEDGSRVIIKQAPEAAVKQTKSPETNLNKTADSDFSSLNVPKWCLKERSKIGIAEPTSNLAQGNLSRLSIKRQSPINVRKDSPLIKQPLINVTAEDSFEHFGKYVAAELRDLPTLSAILLQQELQDSIIRAKLAYLKPIDSDEVHPEILHVDINAESTYSNSDDENRDVVT